MDKIILPFVVGAFTLLGISIVYLWLQVSSCNTHASTLQLIVEKQSTDIKLREMQIDSFVSAVTIQNEQIDNVKVDFDLAVEHYEEIQKLPAEIKWRTLYERVPAEIVEKESDECVDIKRLLDGLMAK